MRILHLAAGAGAMYCGACTRDVTLLRGMAERGHDVWVVPLYTPLRLEYGPELPSTPLFLGGINAYLQQVSALFRHSPDWLDRLLDSPGLLRWAARFAVTVRPEELGPMTVSVLAGRNGRQRKEIDRLLAYLQKCPKPDIVCLTNSLLSGMAPEVKERLRTPIACSFQGEDAFLDALPEPYRERAWAQIRLNAEAIDLFLATSANHGETMARLLSVPASRVRVVRAGIDSSAFMGQPRRTDGPIRVGCLGVIHRPKGLDILVDAFVNLVQGSACDAELWVAGKVLDRGYWRRIRRSIERADMQNRFHFRGEVAFPDKVWFLRSCDVFVVPSRVAEARGIVALEAMASGAPVIAPRSGVFPEMMALTNGGELFEPESVQSLTSVLSGLLLDSGKRLELGRNACDGVSARYSAGEMVDRTLDEYAGLASISESAARSAGQHPLARGPTP